MKKILLILSLASMLMMPVCGQDNVAAEWITGGGYDAPENVPSMRLGSLEEAISRRPALPTVDDLMSAEAKAAYAKRVLAYEQAAQLFHGEQQMAMQRLQGDIVRLGNEQRQKQARQQQAMQQASDKGLMPSQQEIMQAIMSSGLDLEHATEEQMMNVVADMYAKKWNISQDDARTFMAMATTQPQKAEAFLKQKYPALYQNLASNMPDASTFADDDANEQAYGQIGDELMALSEQAREYQNSVMDMNKHLQNDMKTNAIEQYAISLPGLPTNELEQLYWQTLTAWASSDECEQAGKMEKALYARLDEWMVSVKAKEGGVPYPQWWVDERKKENALVDAWNKRQAEAWLAAMTKHDTQMQAMAQKLIALDNQLESLRGGKPMTVAYAMAKTQVHAARMTMYNYFTNCSAALHFPHVSRQPEQGIYDPIGGN